MVEFLRHATGLCGEHSHPSLMTLVLSSVGGLSIFSYIKLKYFKRNNNG